MAATHRRQGTAIELVRLGLIEYPDLPDVAAGERLQELCRTTQLTVGYRHLPQTRIGPVARTRTATGISAAGWHAED